MKNIPVNAGEIKPGRNPRKPRRNPRRANPPQQPWNHEWNGGQGRNRQGRNRQGRYNRVERRQNFPVHHGLPNREYVFGESEYASTNQEIGIFQWILIALVACFILYLVAIIVAIVVSILSFIGSNIVSIIFVIGFLMLLLSIA